VPLERNLPVLLGLLDVWYGTFLGAQSQAILPVQRVPRPIPGVPPAAGDGEQRQVGDDRRNPGRLAHRAVVWGEPGTNGQHAFFQLLHQGTRLVPCDFIGS